MAKILPYYPMYVYDFDESPRVLAMTLAEVGLYLLCMNHAWKAGSIPNNPDEVARLIRRKPSDVRKAWPQVSSCFVEVQPGTLINIRQEDERDKAIGKSDKATVAAQIRHGNMRTHSERITRKSKSGNANALPRAYESVSVSESSSENIEIGAAEMEPAYWSGRLYDRHPKKRNKPLVENWFCIRWMNIHAESDLLFFEEMREIDRVHVLWCATEDWQKDNARFAPKLDEWLADDGWKREPKAAEPKKSKIDLMFEAAKNDN